MINGLTKDLRTESIKYLLFLCLAGALLFPAIEFDPSVPKFELSDLLLLPLLILASLGYRHDFPVFYRRAFYFTWFILGFTLLMLCSIAINGRLGQYRDWFEIFKLLKFLFLVFCFYAYLRPEELYRFLKLLFSLVFIFNILHYFDVFGFNSTIEPYYASWQHIVNFGVNSIGQPDTKRAIGTMGDCNNNAFYFLAFLLLFIQLYFRNRSKADFIFVILALTGIFLSQSRIVFLSLLLLLVLSLLLLKKERRTILLLIGLTMLLFLVFNLGGNVYLSSVYKADQMKDAGIGRLDQWIKILHSMPGHWVFGHGPDKEFFERNAIYAESEYFLILFRYGIAGLLLYLGFLGTTLVIFLRGFRSLFLPFAFLLVYGCNAITNTPFHGLKMLTLFALFAAIILTLRDEQGKTL